MAKANNIDFELQRLQRALWLYSKAAGMTMEDAIRKKAKQLGYALYVRFHGLMPAKGAVKEERLGALKGGEGVHVRPIIYQRIAQKYGALPLAAGVMKFRGKGGKLRGSDKRGLNLQALAVEAELNLRESGRGFLGQSSRFTFDSQVAKAASRYGPTLAQLGFSITGQGPSARLTWGGYSQLSDDAVRAIGRARGQDAVAQAIGDVTRDMMPYLESHLNVTAKQMGLEVR